MKKTKKSKEKKVSLFDLSYLKKITDFMNEENISSINIEDGKNKVSIDIGGAEKTILTRSNFVENTSNTNNKIETEKLHHNQKKITSPFVGTFYRAPSPDQDPFIKKGAMVSKGDVLCIVESMKLMNEISSDVDGKVVSILVENGQPVEYGEPLFILEV